MACHSPTAPFLSLILIPFLLSSLCSFALLTWCDNPLADPLSGCSAQRRHGLPDVTSGVNRVSCFSHKEPSAKKRGGEGSICMCLSNDGGEEASSTSLLLCYHIWQFYCNYSWCFLNLIGLLQRERERVQILVNIKSCDLFDYKRK